ncbi:MAG: saccharopine dehydrogenase C-terminal domain-containing protein [Pseudomonadota bacterium]|nr:saccharopine dehydrogenase C-terminal domain-containing protein [Pseudomonadota bacterium]
MKNRITLIGRGMIGETIEAWLSQQYTLKVLDLKTGFDANNEIEIKKVLQDQEMVIAATPFFINRSIARVAAELEVDYFDLTEDTETSRWIRSLSANSKLIPQCGLAPGIVNMCAQDLINDFERVDEVKLRVGALPRYTSNQLGYYLTWSTEGLINEYSKPVQVIDEGIIKEVKALEDLERLIFEGAEFEAFNTSGGVGQLCQTYHGKIQKLDYKTIRYPGHCERMKLLLQEIGMNKDIRQTNALFNHNLPRTRQDMVLTHTSGGHASGQI